MIFNFINNAPKSKVWAYERIALLKTLLNISKEEYKSKTRIEAQEKTLF